MNMQTLPLAEMPAPFMTTTTLAAKHTGTSLQYLVYLPKNLNRELEPIVFVHGYTRRAQSQLRQLRLLSDSTGRALLAPCFAKSRHRRYQRLGKGTDGSRADHYFNACLDEVSLIYGLPTDRCVLLGYSGGAQFCHRYAMVHPHRVARLIAVAAGWYTFPDPDVAFPRGMATAGKLRAVSMNPEVFLRIPMTVLVGSCDRTSVNLRSNPHLDRQQGSDRVERARRWVLAMRMAARLYHVDADISYQEVPEIGHSFDEFTKAGYLRELVLAAIEDPGPAVAAEGAATEESSSNDALS